MHWRGFSEFKPLPDYLPLTPDYDKVQATPPWLRTPSGWCTRYGSVDELIAKRDDALVLLNGGDELALSFKADRLPPKPAGFERDFFLYVVGWDKDADFHVGQGLARRAAAVSAAWTIRPTTSFPLRRATKIGLRSTTRAGLDQWF